MYLNMWFKRSLFQSFICCLVFIYVNIPNTCTQEDIEVPVSPCPEIFKYRHNGTHFYGYGLLRNPPTDENIVIMVNMIVQVQLTGIYSEKLQLVGTPQEIVNKINSNQTVNFEITFPTQMPLPLIWSILVNDDVICENSKISLNGQTTRITVQHTFKNDGFQPTSQDLNEIYIINPNISILYPGDFPPMLYVPTTTSTEITTTTITTDPVNNFNIECGKIPKLLSGPAFGGTTISKGDWPWLAAIHYYTQSSHRFRCGGTVISRTTILSAAHCFYKRKKRIKPESVSIFLGHHNLRNLHETGSKLMNVDSIIIHPDFRPDGKHYSNIAIAKFTETIEFSEFIQPACLWGESSDNNDVVGQIGVIVGWGNAEITTKPKRVVIPIVSDEICLRSHDAFVLITNERTFCGGWRNGREGPCTGDSGSGMLLNRNGIWYIRGLVSSAVTNQVTLTCDLYEYVVFTDVAKFSSWIESNMI